MHPFVAAVSGLVFMVGVVFLVAAGWLLVSRIPEEQAGAAYQATVWGIVGLILSGLAGARLTGGDNPLQRIVSALGSLANLVRR
jgi:ABC-type long-subunit fatty acid transport system fused permease/ATPase subunit